LGAYIRTRLVKKVIKRAEFQKLIDGKLSRGRIETYSLKNKLTKKVMHGSYCFGGIKMLSRRDF
jgi:hypothetical protein